MDKPQAVGSIWNVNSWHWEMKNYAVPAKAILERRLLESSIKIAPTITG